MQPTMAMSGSYDMRLVALSVFIAVFASYAALDLAGRITASRNKIRSAWLVGGAGAMGLGIWSMHYIGMLALSIPTQMFYDPGTVCLSLLAAMAASAVALYTVSREHMRAWKPFWEALSWVPASPPCTTLEWPPFASRRTYITT